MTVRLPDHLDLIASASEGIKKLRGLILELAVRGKLIPQDPKDEPASELLKRIAKERARLEAEGVCKKLKSLPPVGEDEQAFPIAGNWKWVRLGDAVTHSSAGWSPSCESRPRASEKEWGVLKVSAVSWGIFDPNENKALPTNLEPRPEHEVMQGDFLVSRANTAELVARSVFVEETPPRLMLSDKIVRLRLSAHTAGRYINIVSAGGVSRAYYSRVAGGTSSSMKNVTREQILNLALPLPPLAEQHRIVAKVDELMALCDELEQKVGAGDTAHERLVAALLGTLTQSADAADLATNWQRVACHFDTLFTTESSLDALKQTILQLAVMGKLVPQNQNDEPASDILEAIRKTRSSLYATKKISKPKELPTLDDTELPFYIPSGWTWCMVGDLCYQVSDGPHFSPQYVTAEEGVPFLSTRNVRADSFDLASLKYVSRADHEEFCKRIRPEKGDVIYTKGGTTGIAKVNDLDFEFSVWVHLAVLRIEKERLLPRYVELALNSPHCYMQSQHYTQGISNFDLGLTRMIKITTPLPPLAEQHRIVAKVDELMALVDRLKTDLAVSRHQQSRLADTLIDSALHAVHEKSACTL